MVIGDARNDENRVISQIQLAMIRFHNKVCDQVRADQGTSGHDLFEEARRLTMWHYQWCVVLSISWPRSAAKGRSPAS